MTAHPSAIAATAEDLARALRQGGLHLRYQPKISLTTGRLVGAEALARWFDPEFGQVSPSLFIPMAERHGLIHDLTRQVVSMAARQGADWALAGLTVNIAVNVSASNLDDMDFPDLVERLCAEEDFPCHNLTIELTESTTQSVTTLLDTLTRMRLKGMHLSLDDFGTGYSSLVQLHQLPFSELKIDQSFVLELEDSQDSRVIVRSTIDLAHNLKMRTVAEGVETLEALTRVADMGCNIAQGYHIARPMPPVEFVQWASQWETNQAMRLKLLGRLDATADEPGEALAGAQSLLAQAELLVVNDYRGMAQVLRPLLLRTGLTHLNVVVDGNVALHKLRERRYDLVLADIHAEPMDGPTLLREIRHDPHLRDLPFIMILENDDPAQVAALKAAGATDCVTKPIVVPTLRGQLATALRSQAKPRA